MLAGKWKNPHGWYEYGCEQGHHVQSSSPNLDRCPVPCPGGECGAEIWTRTIPYYPLVDDWDQLAEVNRVCYDLVRRARVLEAGKHWRWLPGGRRKLGRIGGIQESVEEVRRLTARWAREMEGK